jgi:PAS domain S-box-containing protein
VVDRLTVGIAVADPAGTTISLNAEALRIHGFAAEAEMLRGLTDYASPFELCHPGGAPMPFEDWPASRAARGEYVQDFDGELVRHDTGERKLVRYSVVPILDAAGAVSLIVYHMLDRTEQERAARALRIVEGRLSSVVRHAALGVAIADGEGRFQECNPAFCRIAGYDHEELLSLSFPEIVHPDDREANLAQIRRLQAGVVPSFEIENRYLRGDGTPVWVHKHVSVVPDAAGRPQHLMAVVTDVTERRKADERRRWEEARNVLLLRLLQEQRRSADEGAVMAAAAEGLGRLLGADRVGFYRVEGDTLTRTVCWSGGALPPLAGPIPASTLGSTLLARSRAGQTTAIADVHRFDWTSEAIPGLEGVGAIVAAPVHRVSGEWYAGVYVHDAERRDWQERDIALISEIAYQAWEGIERMRAQAELRLALDASAAGIWSVDLDTRAVSWDERSGALFGFAPGVPVTFEAMASRLHDEDRVHVTARLEDVRMNAGLDEWDMEFRVPRPDGSSAWIHGIGRAERDARGKATRLSGINLDVTARKQAETALREVRDQQREHAETMRLLLEGASQGILSIDSDGTILTANAALEAMFGWEPGSLAGQPIDVLLPRAVRERHRRHQAEYFAAPRSRVMAQGRELLGQRRDGSSFPVEISLNQVQTVVGQRAIAFVTDITERQRASERLRDSEQRLRLALDAASAGAWSWDLDTNLVTADARTCARLGQPPDQPFPQERFETGLHPEDVGPLLATIQSVRDPSGPGGWDLEYRRLGADGRVTWHQSIARASRDAVGRVTRVAGITLDITARKEAEAEVARSHEALRAYAGELEARTMQLRRLASDLTLAEQRAREQLAKTLHDDLQQLLFGAMLKIDRASRGAGGTDLLKRARSDVQEAIAAARSLSVELFPPGLRQRGLPSALEWLADWTHQKYNVEVRVTVDQRADTVDEDVRLLLFESVRKLLFNAVKHGRITRIELDVALDEAGGLAIRVADAGVGFDTSAAFGVEGQLRGGLGLVGIRERLAVLGGRMDVDSEPGHGARFVLRVPRSAAGGHPVPRRVRVLLADDHAVVREGLRELLSEQQQLEVVGEAADGVEAVAQAHALLPDVVLMDVCMPRMDGIEATRRIRAELPDVQVFGLSTQDHSEAHPIERAGAAAYFSKNDGAERLIAGLVALQDRIGPVSGRIPRR